MAKRFVDTNLFDDDWVVGLSKDGKLFFFYFITKCDHAGMLKINKKIISFQIGIEDVDSVIMELNGRLIHVSGDLYFMPKFIDFQYPNFPKSTVMQQHGAINLLKSKNLWDYEKDTYLTTQSKTSEVFKTLRESLKEI